MRIDLLKTSEKNKTLKWYKEVYKLLMPSYNHDTIEYERRKRLYEIYNDNIESLKTELAAQCDIELGDVEDELKDEMQAFPVFHSIVDIMKGELYNRSDDHRIVLRSIKAIAKKNEQLAEAIQASMEDMTRFVEQQQPVGQEGQAPPTLDQMQQQGIQTPDVVKRDFMSSWEVFFSKSLQRAEDTQNIKMKKVDCLQDLVIQDSFFIYSGWLHGQPYLEVRNPLYLNYEKAPNDRGVQKSNMIVYRKPITIDQAFEKWESYLTKKELEDLQSFSSGTNTTGSSDEYKRSIDLEFDTLGEVNRSRYQDKTIGLHQTLVDDRIRYNLIFETHVEFKAYKRMYFMYYKDEHNKDIILLLTKDFDIPEDAKTVKRTNRFGRKNKFHIWFDELSGTQFELEEVWIPRKYELVQLGEDIYPVYREVPFQETNIHSPYSTFTLSTFGGEMNTRNASSISLMERALPLYKQYLMIKMLQNREIAKYQGYVQKVIIENIPKQLGMDIDGEMIKDPIAVWSRWRTRKGLDFESQSQNALVRQFGQATGATDKGSYILGTAAEIYRLEELGELIKKNIMLSIGVSPQRMAQFSQYSTATADQQSLIQSHHITEPYIYFLNQNWAEALTDWVKNFRSWCRSYLLRHGTPPMFEYAMPDGTKELFKITEDMLDLVDFGFTLTHGNTRKLYYDAMMQRLDMVTQNIEHVEKVSKLVRMITSGSSPEEFEMALEKEKQRVEAAEKQMQEQQQQMQIQAQQQLEAKELARLKLEKEYDKQIAIIKSTAFNPDLNEDGVHDITQSPLEEKIQPEPEVGTQQEAPKG